MSHEGGPESTQQRTVAELLAMYGAENSERAPRRRRRRDESSDTGAYSIVDRVNSESARLSPIREDQPPPSRTSHRPRTPQHQQPSGQMPAVDPRAVDPRPAPPRRPPAPPARPVPPPPQRPPAPPQPSQQHPAPHQQLAQPPAQQLPKPPPHQQPRPGISQPVPPTRPVPPRAPRPAAPLPPQAMPSGSFPMATGPMAPHGSGYFPAPPQPARPPEAGVTEQMPRVGQAPTTGRNATGTHQVPFPPARAGFGPTGVAGAPPAPEFTELTPDGDKYSEPDEDYEDYPEGDAYAEGDEDDYADDYADEDIDDKAPSAGREWLIMAAQVAISVVGGAAVWLGFNWLWGRYPQAALVAALIVIVGLVWIVRKIRKADDLQTTLLAVLVGLFVTVSPAALLLLSK